MGLIASARRMMGLDGRDDARRGGEADVPMDTATARSRATGGVEDPDALNPNSSTGTTPNGTFVGRASADESDTRPSAAELEAEQAKKERGDNSAGGAARRSS